MFLNGSLGPHIKRINIFAASSFTGKDLPRERLFLFHPLEAMLALACAFLTRANPAPAPTTEVRINKIMGSVGSEDQDLHLAPDALGEVHPSAMDASQGVALKRTFAGGCHDVVALRCS